MAAAKMILITCSVCLDEFEDPRALPCLHTFCLDCLVGLRASTPHGRLKCPMCKEEHEIPQNGAHGFRKDFRMKSFMEVNKTEEVHVKPTLCKQHPTFELTHYCEEYECGQALCIQCVTQNHQNHKIQPMKRICEAKLSHLKLMAEAIELNHQLVQSAREKLEENKSEIHDKLNSRVKDLHAQLDEEAKKNSNYIDKMISEAHDLLNVKENDIRRAKDRQKVLEIGFSDTIPNIVKVNADKHLNANLSNLYEMLNNWSLNYSYLKVVNLDLFKNMKKNWVVKMPEQSVTGVPVALFEPVESKVATLRKEAASTSQKPNTLVQSSPNSVQKKKRKVEVIHAEDPFGEEYAPAEVIHAEDPFESDLDWDPEQEFGLDEDYGRRPLRRSKRFGRI